MGKSGPEIWREAIAHLRYLSAEFWKTAALFYALMLAVLLAMFVLARFHPFDDGSAVLILVLSIVGIVISAIGRYTLKRVRIYYVQMLAKKSLLEDELGFYLTKFTGSETDLAFPWRITPEAIVEIRKDFDGWVAKSAFGEKTIARYQFWFFNGAILLFSIGLVGALVKLLR
jgi:hypothetical protein